MAAPVVNAIVARLPHLVPFVGPEAMARARGRPFRARLGANESMLGASPRAAAAMREATAENWKYADPENHDLKAAAAALHGVDPGNVTVGEGIDGLLGHAVRIFTDPGAAVVTSDGAYPTFNFHVLSLGCRLVKVPFRNDREDIGALLDRARAEKARIVYVSNPNSPMGTWWPASEIEAMAAALPDGTLLCLDEAYCDTAPLGSVPEIAAEHPQVIRFRTVSKAYGLAGARIGYALGAAANIAHFDKVRNHYGINRVGQVGALAALADQAFLAEAVLWIAAGRRRIAAIADENGLSPIPSRTNFVAIDCGGGAAFAGAVLEEVLARDVFIRRPVVAPLDRCIRVSCGFEPDLDLFAEALPAALAAARQRPGS